MFKSWVKADVSRKACIENVLSTGVIRFGLLSGEFIIDEIEPFLLSTGQSSYIQELLSSCKNYQILSSSRRQNYKTSVFLDVFKNPRNTSFTTPTMVLVGGINETSRLTGTYGYQKLLSGYEEITLPAISTEHKSAHSYFVNVLNNNIYITGGHHAQGNTMKYCSMFDTHLNEWVTLSELNNNRERHTGVVIDHELYRLSR